ncbi:PIN domain-containing protein [Geoglobus acetivorans]|uniref:Type II toxin-antitoxin system VapC family toxin n=1 Tax=Geoglobus acetivorans TaxID=565033 RepID=A0ABZ3H5A3_GEOAI|nr:type II toxin-antitoxin system VapC family toxin [Geoglobus acetivorans]
MIVIDTSVLIDYVFEKDVMRNNIAKETLKLLRGLRVFAPRILLIEFVAVARRLGMTIPKLDVVRLTADFVLLPEDTIFEEAFRIAEHIHPRAADAYFIATARLTNSILITNDRVMASNAKKAGVEAYYLIEEFEKAAERLREME